MSGATVSVVFEPAWEDNPTWEGCELYADLARAQVLAADAYVREMYELLDEHDEGPGELVWTQNRGSWGVDGRREADACVDLHAHRPGRL